MRANRELTDDELERIEQFIEAYAQIEKYLRKDLRRDAGVPFSNLVSEFGSKKKSWHDEETLKMMGNLRNVIIHERFGTIKNLSVPIPSIVEKIKLINSQLINPERVFPKYKRDVKTFQTNDVLTIILGSVRKDQYSQFPIYNGKDFVGLITENGITRWLATHCEEVDPLIALKEVKAEEILSLEENPKNYLFISRDTSVLDAENYFIESMLLEALFITHSGIATENLIGIITRWDLPKLSMALFGGK